MPPGAYHLDIYQGDVFTLSLDFDVDLTGYTLEAQIRHDPDDTTPAETLTVTVTDAANGLVQLSLTAVETAALLPQRYWWDLQWTDPSGDVRTILRGRATVTAEITR